MSEFVDKHQFLIKSIDAKAIGKKGLYDKLDKSMVEFFNAICKAVLNGDDDIYAIQWAISKLNNTEKLAIEVERAIKH